MQSLSFHAYFVSKAERMTTKTLTSGESTYIRRRNDLLPITAIKRQTARRILIGILSKNEKEIWELIPKFLF